MKTILKFTLMSLIAITVQSCGALDGTANYWEYNNSRYYSYQGKLKVDSKTRNNLILDSTSFTYNRNDITIQMIRLERSILTYKFDGKAKNLKHVKNSVKNCLKNYYLN